MIASYRMNLLAGLIGFAGTLLLSLPNNIWKTALTQSLYSFLFLFLFTYLVRWLLALLIRTSEVNASETADSTVDSTTGDESKGSRVNLVTPDEGLFIPGVEPGFAPQGNPNDESNGEAAFTPLSPPKLTTKMEHDPEELVRALRRMTEE